MVTLCNNNVLIFLLPWCLAFHPSYGPAHRERTLIKQTHVHACRGAVNVHAESCKGYAPVICIAHVILNHALQFCITTDNNHCKLKLTSAGAK